MEGAFSRQLPLCALLGSCELPVEPASQQKQPLPLGARVLGVILNSVQSLARGSALGCRYKFIKQLFRTAGPQRGHLCSGRKPLATRSYNAMGRCTPESALRPHLFNSSSDPIPR